MSLPFYVGILFLLYIGFLSADPNTDVQNLREKIRTKDRSFTSSHILCNCSSPGCDFDLVTLFGYLFKGLCRSDGLCMKTLEKESDTIYTNYYCVLQASIEPPRARLPFICLDHKKKTHLSRVVCCSENLCNGEMELKLSPPPTEQSPIYIDDLATSEMSPWRLAVCISLPLCAILTIIILYLLYRYQLLFPHNAPRKPPSQPWMIDMLCEGGSTGSDLPLMKDIDGTKRIIGDLLDDTGSGVGGPLLIPRTIANQITLKETIGQGRFGEVIRGVWKGDDVAVKIFASRDEKAYSRELDVYLTTMMRHPNILHFIAADNKGAQCAHFDHMHLLFSPRDTGEVMQLWLVTELHPNGALLDYLTVKTVTPSGLCRMIRSLANGLAFLHSEIEGTLYKPAIAHRDLKSRNILVKNDGQLCVADLGLAVRYYNSTKTLDLPCNRVGTVRYLAPEVLSDTIMAFDSFRMADIYSMGLIMWEIARRTVIDEDVEPADYQLPYYDAVSSNPSQVEMCRVVVEEQRRPELPSKFDRDPVLDEVHRTMCECWAANPHVRNQALVVRNMIDRLCLHQHIDV